MKIAAVQMDIFWHDRQGNLQKAREFFEEAAKQNVDLIIFPEMFSTGFSMDTSITGEEIDGATPELLRSLAKEHGINVTAGFVLHEDDEKPKNVAITIDRDGNDLSLYAKSHLIRIMDEDLHYSPGDGPVAFEIEGVGTSVFICYDLRFPEIFRAVAADVSLMVVIASWPSVRATHWDQILPTRAIENQCYVIGLNRVGEGGGCEFAGRTVIVNPLGEVVYRAGDQEELIVADLDLSEVKRLRTEMPFLTDQRTYP